MARATGVAWTRDQRLVALNLYCKLPFGKLHKGNPVIKEIALKMGRTPSSLALKLCNFASLDPVLKARGISGMKGAAQEDKYLWDEFRAKISVLGPQSEELLHDLLTSQTDQEVDLLDHDRIRLEPSTESTLPIGSTETTATVKIRRGQQFFRQSILSAYGVRCCISGINVPRLLVASHIKPWSDFPNERLDLCNGLCLSSLHDAAFDDGLITLDERVRVVLSKRLRDYFPQSALEENFIPYKGVAIRLPERLAEPSPAFIRYHRETIFRA
jgi:putative restriction endonuclease